MKLAGDFSFRFMVGKSVLFILLGLASQIAWSGNVEIRFVDLTRTGDTWQAAVTLAHADTGWNHYADGWRLVTVDGKVLGHRTLWHPHVDEQPFTRQLSDIKIPANIKTIVVEAHDTVHGWSPDKVKIDLGQSEGKRYRVNH
ncbi:MAG TPA: hypothetical protein ENI64_06380 [Gammaproteobacteria bacterium]|nr:hypothetical protein [Gammaproteobacteria bacterium]